MITHEELKWQVFHWSKKIGVKPIEIHVREMKRKWASCSSKGRLTFNKAIMKKSEDFLKEVIVHELLHLKYPNHGKMFKVLMRSYLNAKN
ncbi:MAG: M48 family metallopeptidase [Nitrospirae bacterium]|nr:M48 family metallopeptidase [Nitrospirota bacterium]